MDNLQHICAGVLIAAALLFPATMRSAPADSLDPDMKSLFPEADSLQWVRAYCGYWNELHTVGLQLGYDGTHCRGWVRYGNTGTRLKWEGVWQDGEFRVYESDTLEGQCAFIQGRMTDNRLTADWQNTPRSLGAQLVLSRCDNTADLAEYAPPERWLRYYTGVVGNDPITLLLQRDATARVRGVWYFPHRDTAWVAAGYVDTAKGVYELKPQPIGSHPGATVVLDSFVSKKAVMHWTQSDGVFQHGVLKWKEAYPVEVFVYMDYYSDIAFRYPVLKSPAFNNWFGQLISDWMRECTQFTTAFRESHPLPDAKQRASIRAFSWTDTELITRRIASGQVHYSNSWSQTDYGRAFNFDLKKEKEINLEDIFKPEFSYKTFVEAFIRPRLRTHTLYEDADFRAWLDQEDFRIFLIRRDGITFSTRFNYIFGEASVTIPYGELQSYISATSPVRSVMQESYGIVLPQLKWPAFLKKNRE